MVIKRQPRILLGLHSQLVLLVNVNVDASIVAIDVNKACA